MALTDLCKIKKQAGVDSLVLSVSGRIDSNNAPEVKQEILDFIKDEAGKDLTLDAENLEYLSSAGLRVLLQLKKMLSQLRLINVKPEVYDILEMTGFNEILQVEKCYRHVSIEGAELIGEGANGMVYRVDQDCVVKVYKHGNALEDIRTEQEKARLALVLGIPTAISYDVVKVGDRYGSVFELLNARSFSKLLGTEPERFSWCVEQFADMLKLIHQTEVPAGKLPQIKDAALEWMEYLKILPSEYYEKAFRLIQEIPADQHMIHGDYHIKNLELQGDEVLLIDMDTLAVGHPIFELGSMYNAFIGFEEVKGETFNSFMGISCEMAAAFFFEAVARYLETQDKARVQEVIDKASIIGYIRLIRRGMRRGYAENEDKKPALLFWTGRLKEMLDKVDTLLF